MKLNKDNIDSLPESEDQVKQPTISKNYLMSLFPDVDIKDSDIDNINSTFKGEDPDSVRDFIANIVEFRDLIKSEHCKSIQHFLTSMKFVSYMNLGCSTFEAYIRSHSYSKVVQVYMRDKSKHLEEQIDSASKLFSKSKLVILIQQSSDVPLNLLYAGYRYQAIDRLRKEMNNASYARDRIMAADKLLTHLAPQAQQNNVNIHLGNSNQINIIDGYQDELRKLAEQQLKLISTNKDDAFDIINVKCKEDED
ncbi:hypothetical protein HRO53_002080 [Campylobacter coli]|nr:hypothetical protein [Campylobacter coli]EFV1206346.1 hypothetical protein [Campylobacter coli]